MSIPILPITAKPRMPLAQGQHVAAEIRDLIADACQHVEVVGSVRRCAPTVKDVELLVEPKVETRVVDLFGGTEDISLFEARCDELRNRYTFISVVWGPRLKRFLYEGAQVELFICLPPSQWGLAQVVRTGPADFSHQLVMPRGHRYQTADGGYREGLLPPTYRVHDLGIYDGPRLIETPTEESVFEVIGLPYQPPEARR